MRKRSWRRFRKGQQILSSSTVGTSNVLTNSAASAYKFLALGQNEFFRLVEGESDD